MAKWQGARVTEMPVTHRARVHGSSKYGVSRLVSGFLDLLTLLFLNKFATKPLHFFGLFGLLFFLFGGAVFGYFGFEWLKTGALHLRPLIVVGGFSLLMGIQLFSIGFLAELMSRNKEQRYPIAETVRDAVETDLEERV